MAITRIGNIASTIPDDSIQNVKFSNIVQSKNIIINGDMSIAQRGTSVSSITGNGYYTCDRFNFEITNAGTWTISQSTDVPTGQGFAKSLKLDCTTADASLGASDKFLLKQIFEGQMLQYLKKGTANAVSLTLSFWVKSNKIGTYTNNFYDYDNNRQISKTYTIDVANTWEKKTITFEGDTTGAFDNDNIASLELVWCLGTGTNFNSGTLQTTWATYVAANRLSSSNVNLADSTANEFYITGVQLEAGTTASEFEFLPVDVNLERCNRYFQQIDAVYFNLARWNNDTGVCITQLTFPKTMRAGPTITFPGTWFTGNGYIGTPTANNILPKCFAVTGPSIGANEIEYAHGGIFQMDAEL